MYVIRPIATSDLDSLTELAFMAAPGMISLPKDQKLLESKIDYSLASFEKDIEIPGEESYLFALENMANGQLAGCCGIYAKTGESEPSYFFQVKMLESEAETVKMLDDIYVLEPIKMLHGPAELCSLYLRHELRKEGLGQLLSFCRFLFIANNRGRFDQGIMARLRGIVKEESSPFWDGIWAHFLEMNFIETLYLLERSRDFVPEIIPEYPIYIPLLPMEAQSAINEPHETTRPAMGMLNQQGLQQTGLVDLFDGGPVLMGRTEEVHKIRESQTYTITEIGPVEEKKGVISNTRLDFRACYGGVEIKGEHVKIDKKIAEALHVEPGENVRYVAL